MDTCFLSSLHLKNFRVYQDLKLNFSGSLIIFTGQNGIGKTSILEAISLASLLKSFRGVNDKDIIQWSHLYFAISLKYSLNEKRNSLHIGYGKSVGEKLLKRKLKVNNEPVTKISDFIGQFQTITFSPDDIRIIDTTPEERRKFVDMMLSSLSSIYLSTLQRYKKILKQRSSYLKQIKYRNTKADSHILNSYNKQLAECGSFLTNARGDFIKEFQQPFMKYINLISSEKDYWNMSYVPSVKAGFTEETYMQVLKSAEKNDIRLGQTTKGIHRDKFEFLSHEKTGSKELQLVASQGQKRTVALALKMAQFDFTEKRLQQKPILLIDDVLNELDIERRQAFISFLDKIGQAFVTTTDIEGMQDFISKKSKGTQIQIFDLKRNDQDITLNEIIQPNFE